MFQKIVSHMVERPQVCQGCGKMVTPQQMENGGQMWSCPECGYVDSSAGWLSGQDDLLAPWPDVAQQPAGNQIVREETEGKVSWAIPRKKGVTGLLLFGIVWMGFVSVFSFFFISAAFRGEVTVNGTEEVASPWAVVGGMSIFVTVGVVLVSIGLSQKFTRRLLTVADGRFLHAKELFGRKSMVSLNIDEVDSVELVSFYQQNNRPVYGLQILSGKRKVKFGSALKEDEKRWLVTDLRQQLLPVQPSSSPPLYPQTASMPVGEPPVRQSVADREGARPQEGEVCIPPDGAAVLGATMGVIFLLVGGGVIYWGIVRKLQLEESPEYFLLLFGGFFVLLGCYAVGYSLYNAGVSTCVKVSEQWVRVYRVRGAGKTQRRLKAEVRREEVLDIRMERHGSQNEHSMYKMQLFTQQKPVNIAYWRKSHEIQPSFQELEALLRPERVSS